MTTTNIIDERKPNYFENLETKDWFTSKSGQLYRKLSSDEAYHVEGNELVEFSPSGYAVKVEVINLTIS